MKGQSLILLCTLLGSSISSGTAAAQHNPGARPANPCAAKPAIDPKRITRPAGYAAIDGDARLGEKLWSDTSLSTNGMSCNACHQGHAAFQAGFVDPYPHTVAMAKREGGIETVHLDEMIQICMLVPMAGQPLPWNSKELAGLVAYTQNLQKTFRPGAPAPVNPCSAKSANPYAAKPVNPCAKR